MPIKFTKNEKRRIAFIFAKGKTKITYTSVKYEENLDRVILHKLRLWCDENDDKV